MTIYAEITDGVVSNTILSDNKLAEHWVLCPKGVGIGYLFNGTTFSPPVSVFTEEEIREERDGLLVTSDWTQVDDAPVDKSAWATYRQALRDLPAAEGFPTSVTWPVAPS